MLNSKNDSHISGIQHLSAWAGAEEERVFCVAMGLVWFSKKHKLDSIYSCKKCKYFKQSEIV